MKATCPICPHACSLSEGQAGLCRARANRCGRVVDENYGMLTALALDPVEKKPLRRFFPGSMILSAGSYGCNLRCPFCQNSGISMRRTAEDAVFVAPEELVARAQDLRGSGNIGVAYTYNEPIVGYEYVRDTAQLAHADGLKNVLVTNGYLNEKPLRELLPLIDAMNIDLKAFSERFYHMAGGDLQTVKRTIRIAAAFCHVEVTTLIIPGENDTEAEMDELAAWLASVKQTIPLHVTRFFPCYHMTDREATPIKTVYRLAEIARRHLAYVYEGNC